MTAPPPAIIVSHPWSRPAIGTGVVYLTMADPSRRPDALVGASSPVAAHVELHESFAVGGGASMGMPGMRGEAMRRVPRIAITGGGSASASPGGYHIMLIGLRHDLHAGERFPVTLRFAHAMPETVVVTVATI